jgi:hypothetical protein
MEMRHPSWETIPGRIHGKYANWIYIYYSPFIIVIYFVFRPDGKMFEHTKFLKTCTYIDTYIYLNQVYYVN